MSGINLKRPILKRFGRKTNIPKKGETANMCNERIKIRIMAIFLVFCMLASSMPLLAYAAEGTEADQAQQVTEEKQEGTELFASLRLRG